MKRRDSAAHLVFLAIDRFRRTKRDLAFSRSHLEIGNFRRPSAVLAPSLPPAGWLAGLMLTSSTMLSERLAPISGLSFVLFRFFFFVFNFSFDDVQSTNHSSAPDAYRSKPLFILNFQNYVFLYLFESA